ncbi:hypothetical protein GE21DRAFT_1273647 [Neurospora crassa]|nr:hypothetical protein GE21DRAFT_1273647 [Neurospora crassa]
MANANFESPSRRANETVQVKRANDSDNERSSNSNYISGNKKSPTPINDYNSPEPQQPSTSAKTPSSIEVSHHSRYSESNVSPLERVDGTIADTIEDDSNEYSSEYLEPTTDGDHTSSTPSTQRSRELTVEDDKNEPGTLPHAASSPSPSLSQPQNPSPFPSLLLAELPHLSPTPTSSATASFTPKPPASSRVNFSPPPPSVSSSYTSIPEDDSDEEDWDDEMFNL